MADKDRIHVIENDINTSVSNIGKTGLGGRPLSEPARSRGPISDAITKIAEDSADSLDYLEGRVESNLSKIADYSSIFTYASDLLYNELKDRERLAAINESAEKTARLLKEPTTEYTKDGETPKFAWTETAGKWVLSTPKWPRFNRFNVTRQNAITGGADAAFEDSVKYTASGDREGFVDVNLMDWFSGMRLTAGLVPAFTHTYPTDSNGVFIDPQTGQPKDSMRNGAWDYNLNGRARLHITVPQGLAGDDSYQMQFRPFFTDKVWTNGNIADGMPSDLKVGSGRVDTIVNGHIIEVANEAPGRPMAGAIIIFQKCAVRENSSKAKSASNQTKLATMYAEGTDTVVIEDNWDWYHQVAIYLPRGAYTTACYTDVKGNKYFQDVAWGARPTIDACYWSQSTANIHMKADEDYEPGMFIFSGGRYMSANGKTKFGWAFKGSHGSGIPNTEHWMLRSTSPASPLGIVNTKNRDVWIDRYATSGSSAGMSLSAANTKDNCAAKYFMVPVKIIGVYDRLTASQEDELRR